MFIIIIFISDPIYGPGIQYTIINDRLGNLCIIDSTLRANWRGGTTKKYIP